MAITIPEHGINQIVGGILMPLTGHNGNEIAEAVENAKTPEEKIAARKLLWKVPGFTGATGAEKADIVAALSYLFMCGGLFVYEIKRRKIHAFSVKRSSKSF